MNLETLKVILEVLLQELNNESEINNDYLSLNSFKLSKELFSGIIPDIFESVVEDLKKKAKEMSTEEGGLKKIIYKALLVIFLNTSQQERFLYFHSILEHFYNKLVQKLIELKKFTSIVSIEDFTETITKLLPFVKLQVVKDISERGKIGDKLKVSLLELYETLLFSNISREDCYQIIKNKLVDCDDVEFSDFDIKPVDQKNGFLGEYFKLKILITNHGKTETHHFFFKHMPTNIDEIRMVIAEMSFKKEEAYYMRIIPYLRKLGCAEVTNFLPNCYLTRKNRFMVFDDAAAQDFSNLDLTVPFTYEQLSLSLKQLAKFHSCGLIFEEKVSKILGFNFRMNIYYSNMLRETFAIRNDANTEAFFGVAANANNFAFEKFSHIFKPGEIEQFKKECSEACFRYFDVCEPSKIHRNFVTHGDLWCNNILFTSDQTSCLLLDFQIIRYNLPAYDIGFLLSVTTDLKTRVKYGLRLLDEYYSNLKSNLSKFDVNIEKILTYDQFLRNVEDVKPTSLTMALSYLLFMLLPREKMDRVFEDPELSQAFFLGDRTKILKELWDDLKHTSRFEGITQELYLLLNKD